MRLFLDKYGLNLLAVPREGAAVGDAYVYDGKRVSPPGSVSYLLEPPVQLPRQRRNERLADVAGSFSDRVALDIGLSLLEGFFAVVGAAGLLDKVGAAYHKANADSLRFRFSDASRDSVDPMQLGYQLRGHKFAQDNPLWAETSRFYVTTAVARASSISVIAETKTADKIDLDVSALATAKGSTGISIEKSDIGEVVYHGTRALAFGLELFELAYDQQRQGLQLKLPEEAIRVREESRAKPAFIGDPHDEAFIAIEG